MNLAHEEAEPVVYKLGLITRANNSSCGGELRPTLIANFLASPYFFFHCCDHLKSVCVCVCVCVCVNLEGVDRRHPNEVIIYFSAEFNINKMKISSVILDS